MITKFYDEEYITNAIAVLKDAIGDISNWSVHNDDRYNDEVYELEQLVNKLEE